MNRKDLSKKLAGEMKISNEEADRIVLAFCNGIVSGVVKSGKVAIQGLGTFEVRDKKAVIARKPKTGEPVSVPAKVRPWFRPSKHFSLALNNGGGHV